MKSRIDTRSATWVDISNHVQTRMKEMRNKLESNLSFEETQQLRARLSELKGVLELAAVPDAPLVDIDFDMPG